MQRIGVLMGYAESNVEGQAFVAAFREELLKLGWAEGRNLRSDYRWAPPGDAEATRRFAKELVTLQPNLILAHNTAATAAMVKGRVGADWLEAQCLPSRLVRPDDSVVTVAGWPPDEAARPRPGRSRRGRCRRTRCSGSAC